MQSTARKLEQRVTVLERKLRKMRSELKAVRKVSRQPWWKRLSEKEIWQFGDVYVAAVVGRKILARAEVSVGQVDSIALRVEPDEPPPRHANITGWASEKDQWMSQAQELAALATLRVPKGSA